MQRWEEGRRTYSGVVSKVVGCSLQAVVSSKSGTHLSMWYARPFARASSRVAALCKVVMGNDAFWEAHGQRGQSRIHVNMSLKNRKHVIPSMECVSIKTNAASGPRDRWNWQETVSWGKQRIMWTVGVSSFHFQLWPPFRDGFTAWLSCCIFTMRLANVKFTCR